MAQDKIPTRIESSSTQHVAAGDAQQAQAAPTVREASTSVREALASGASTSAASTGHGTASSSEPAASPASVAGAPVAGGSAASAGASASAGAPVSAGASAPTGASAPEKGVLTRMTTWFDTTFPNSRNAVIGGVLGLVAALLLFTIGILKTLVIALLVICGVAIGQYLDGDAKLAHIVQSLLKKQ